MIIGRHNNINYFNSCMYNDSLPKFLNNKFYNYLMWLNLCVGGFFITWTHFVCLEMIFSTIATKMGSEIQGQMFAGFRLFNDQIMSARDMLRIDSANSFSLRLSTSLIFFLIVSSFTKNRYMLRSKPSMCKLIKYL